MRINKKSNTLIRHLWYMLWLLMLRLTAPTSGKDKRLQQLHPSQYLQRLSGARWQHKANNPSKCRTNTCTKRWSCVSQRLNAISSLQMGDTHHLNHFTNISWKDDYIALEWNYSRTTVFLIAIQALRIHSLSNGYKNKKQRVSIVIHPETKLPKI